MSHKDKVFEQILPLGEIDLIFVFVMSDLQKNCKKLQKLQNT
jgi:hypothetical protein